MSDYSVETYWFDFWNGIEYIYACNAYGLGIKSNLEGESQYDIAQRAERSWNAFLTLGAI